MRVTTPATQKYRYCFINKRICDEDPALVGLQIALRQAQWWTMMKECVV